MDALIKYFENGYGRRKKLATDLGITPGAISQWTAVPMDKVVAIEKATGVPRQKLRPDLYKGMKVA